MALIRLSHSIETQMQPWRSWISELPAEVLELIVSQPVLSFRDVLAISSTSRRIYAVAKILISQPLCIGDQLGTDRLDQALANPALAVTRAVFINVKFTLAEPQRQAEQLRQFLIQAPRIRYLCIRRPALDSNSTNRVLSYQRLSRPKSARNPFPLRSVHFRHPGSGAYLGNLTHLELCGLSIHSSVFAHLPQLTHLKLSLDEHHDPYTEIQALELISVAKGCKLQGFEIGMYVIAKNNAERLLVVNACVVAWPELEVLNMFSLADGKVLGSNTSGENLARTVRALAASMAIARQLKQLSIGLVPLNATTLSSASAPSDLEPSETATPGSLAAIASIFRSACPGLELFRCLVPLPGQCSRNEYAPDFEVARAKWEGSGWSCGREDLPKSSATIFGML